MQPRCDETGGQSCPYIVGGNGWLFNTDIILAF